jgi:transglutaminase-like putative cysteine protease
MPRLRASHRTEIRYLGAARESVNLVRLSPNSGRLQRVISARVSVFPETRVSTYLDCYGNTVSWFQLHQPHDRLVVEAHAEVEPLAPPRGEAPDGAADGWDAIADEAYRETHAEFLAPSRVVRWGGALATFAEEVVFDAGRPDWWLRELEASVNQAIVYTPGATRVDTPIERVIEIRRGVCQDLAHVFIALARRRGIATRYVSGWLWEPGAGAPGESHAWAEAFVPGLGWLQYDPTHPEPDLGRYVRVGVGRDYPDVPPLRGSYVGPPSTGMEVEVLIERVEEPAAAA